MGEKRLGKHDLTRYPDNIYLVLSVLYGPCGQLKDTTSQSLMYPIQILFVILCYSNVIVSASLRLT